MFRYILRLWSNWRSKRLIDSAVVELESRLNPYLAKVKVNDELTLTSYELGNDALLNWTGEANFPFWQGHLQIELHNGKKEPSEDQLVLLRELLRHPESMRSSILKHSLDFYDRCVYPFRDTRRNVLTGDKLPRVESPLDMAGLLGDGTIKIDETSTSSPVDFVVGFLPAWTDERDLEIFIRDWKIYAPSAE